MPRRRKRDEIGIGIGNENEKGKGKGEGSSGMFSSMVVFLVPRGVQPRRLEVWRRKLLQMGAQIQDTISLSASASEQHLTHILALDSSSLRCFHPHLLNRFQGVAFLPNLTLLYFTFSFHATFTNTLSSSHLFSSPSLPLLSSHLLFFLSSLPALEPSFFPVARELPTLWSQAARASLPPQFMPPPPPPPPPTPISTCSSRPKRLQNNQDFSHRF